MRERVIAIVEQYTDAVRRNDVSALPLHPDAVCEFLTNTYRGAAAFRQGLDQFARIMKSIDVIRLVVNGQIVSIRGYCDPRPILNSSPR